MRRTTLSGLHPGGELAGLSDPILVRAIQAGEAYIDEDGMIAPMPKAMAGFPVAPPLRAKSDDEILRSLKRGSARMVRRRGELGQVEWVVMPQARGGSDFPAFPAVAKQVIQSVFEVTGNFQAGTSGAPASTTVSLWLPIVLPAPFLLSGGWQWTGSAASTAATSVDIGIAGWNGSSLTTSRLYSTWANSSTKVTMNANSSIMAWAMAEGSLFVLPPGGYNMGVAYDATGANAITAFAASIVQLRAMGVIGGGVSSGLGDAITFSSLTAWTTLPFFGISQRTQV